MLYLFILTISPSLFVKSLQTDFQTTSNSSQFIDLENLIGSIHKYLPDIGHLYVKDNGLTSGQKQLLDRYQNVHVISSSAQDTNDLLILDVQEELMFANNNNISTRFNNGVHSNVDLIRKKLNLAVVIPFIEKQFNNFLSLLHSFDTYIPCKTQLESVDLIFYHNEQTTSRINRRIENLRYSHTCFSRIRVLAAALTPVENRYPFGSTMMWIKLLIHEETNAVSLRYYGYTHFFLMEPDTKPIRSYWLDAVIEEIVNGHDTNDYLQTKWWMSGSAYRGPLNMGINFLHINGNAIYHLSLSFIEFIKYFSSNYKFPSDRRIGYDFQLFLYLLRNSEHGKMFWHKFQFSDFIQNCWHSGCIDNDTNFLFNNPNTYLIHGYYVPEKGQRQALPITEDTSSLFQPYLLVILIILLFIFCKVFRTFRYYFYRHIFADFLVSLQMLWDVVHKNLVK